MRSNIRDILPSFPLFCSSPTVNTDKMFGTGSLCRVVLYLRYNSQIQQHNCPRYKVRDEKLVDFII